MPEVLAPEIDEFTIDTANYAEDEGIRAKALKYITGITQQTRQDRQEWNTECERLYNIWDVRRDVRYYTGRADLYIPAGHKAIERFKSKLLARLFPTGDDFFDVRSSPIGMESDEGVARTLDAAKALMWYDLHACMKIRRQMPTWARQLAVTGTSPAEIGYMTAEEVNRMRGATSAQLIRAQSPARLMGERVQRRKEVGPTFRTVDFFTWYVYPNSSDELEDAILVFEDQLVTEQTLLEWRRAGRYDFDLTKLREYKGKVPDDSVWKASRRLQERGVQAEANTGNLYILTTAYGYWNPDDEEDPEGGMQYQFAIVGDELCIQVRQNPWWHQMPPYVCGRLLRYVNEFPGRGLVYPIRKLQYHLNDLTEQTFDSMTYSLNQIAAIDPAFCSDPNLFQYRPGAKWPVPPNAIRWFTPPDVHSQGFQGIRQLYELIQESTGASTGGQYMPTLGVARGAETATGQQLLMAAADLDINDVATSQEEEVFEPMMGMVDSTEQQFLPTDEDRILRALGPKAPAYLQNGNRVRRDQMVGMRTYTWVGSTVSEQRVEFQKQGPAMLGILSKIPPTREGRVNIYPFIKELYRSFNFPDADAVVQIASSDEHIDPAMEHRIMEAGHPVDPVPGEQYTLHIRAHLMAMIQARQAGWGETLAAHIKKTIALMQAEQQAQQAAQMAGLAAQIQGGPGNGGAPQPGQIAAPVGGGV